MELVCLCELGEHEIGFHGRKHFGCQDQSELLERITGMVNQELQSDASELALQVELLAGQYPTYAAIKRVGSPLTTEVQFHCNLDSRPGTRLDRTMMLLECQWMDRPVNITNIHCPSSDKRPWDLNAREGTFPNIFKRAGLVPFNAWGDGVEEPVACIIGGDFNLNENTINNEMKQHQPH